jgi:hypothetical protein
MAEFIPDVNPDLVRQQIITVFSDIFQIEILAGQDLLV